MSPRLHKKLIAEIRSLERKRGKELTDNPEFLDWVRVFRKKYLVDGFLMPFYAHHGYFSIPTERVSQFGDYILPPKRQGESIQNTANAQIHNEELWFWEYLREGQKFISQIDVIPESLMIDGSPAKLIWREIISILSKLDLLGEKGGGIVNAEEMATGYFTESAWDVNFEEWGNEFTERQGGQFTCKWMIQYLKYEIIPKAKSDIEIRPAWFQITRYAFFNTPPNLPVFSCTFSAGLIENLHFLSRELTDKDRAYIGKALMDIPVKFKSIQPRFIRELESIRWWLWHNVGNFECGKILSYAEIGALEGRPRTTIGSAIGRCEKELKQGIDGELLGLILRTGSAVSLDINLVYNTLASKGLIPEREREIDGFDNLNNLI